MQISAQMSTKFFSFYVNIIHFYLNWYFCTTLFIGLQTQVTFVMLLIKEHFFCTSPLLIVPSWQNIYIQMYMYMYTKLK